MLVKFSLKCYLAILNMLGTLRLQWHSLESIYIKFSDREDHLDPYKKNSHTRFYLDSLKAWA